jgi:hypothetical protein
MGICVAIFQNKERSEREELARLKAKYETGDN